MFTRKGEIFSLAGKIVLRARKVYTHCKILSCAVAREKTLSRHLTLRLITAGGGHATGWKFELL